MNERKITVAMVEAYDRKLKEDEHAAATREKYLRSVRAFAVWLDGAAVTKEAVTEWKAHLAERRQAPSTVNTALAALNGLFRFLGWEDCRARFLKVQRRIFRAPERELTRAEYDRLLAAAESTRRCPSCAADGEHLCDRHPRGRGQIPYRRGRQSRPCRGFVERENSDDPAAREALPQAAEICQEAKNRPRQRSFSPRAGGVWTGGRYGVQ